MRVFLSILLFAMAITGFGQNNLKEKKPSGKDSVTLSDYRLKVMQTINANPDSALVYIKKFEAYSASGNYATSLADAEGARRRLFAGFAGRHVVVLEDLAAPGVDVRQLAVAVAHHPQGIVGSGGNAAR